MAEFEYLMDYARQKGEVAALRNAADTIEKLRETLNQIASLIPSSGEGLSLINDVKAFVQRTEGLEFQVVAMRTTLEDMLDEIIEICPDDCGGYPLDDCRKKHCGARKAFKEITAILTTYSAGRDLLERVRKLEAVAKAAKACFEDARDDGEVELETVGRLEETLVALEGGDPA